MPPSACAAQVNVRLRAGLQLADDETSGCGYRCCVNVYRTVLSPIVRDFSHKGCVAKDVHAELQQKFEAAAARAKDTPRQAAARSPERTRPPCAEPRTMAKSKEVQRLDGSDDVRRAANKSNTNQRYRVRRIDMLELGLQNAATKLREAEQERRAAFTAEKAAVEARARAEQSSRHKANAFDRMSKQAEKKASGLVTSAEAARAAALLAEAQATAAAAQAAEDAAAAQARAADAEAMLQGEIAKRLELEA
eukprot:7381322-Prymnesium_polylepis.1